MSLRAHSALSIADMLRDHLATFTGPEPDAPVSTDAGRIVSRETRTRAFHRARSAAERPDLC